MTLYHSQSLCVTCFCALPSEWCAFWLFPFASLRSSCFNTFLHVNVPWSHSERCSYFRLVDSILSSWLLLKKHISRKTSLATTKTHTGKRSMQIVPTEKRFCHVVLLSSLPLIMEENVEILSAKAISQYNDSVPSLASSFPFAVMWKHFGFFEFHPVFVARISFSLFASVRS